MFSGNLKNHVTKPINCEQKEIILLTNKQESKYKKQNVVIPAKKNSIKMKLEGIQKFDITVITQEYLELQLIICAISDMKYQEKFM